MARRSNLKSRSLGLLGERRGCRLVTGATLGVVMILLGAAALPIATPRVQADGTEQSDRAVRILRFPRDRSLGTVHIGEGNWNLMVYRHPYKMRWRYFAEATGEVSVPAESLVMLSLQGRGWTDLSPLSELCNP